MNGATGTANVAAVLRLPSNNSMSSPPSGDRRTERKTVDSGEQGALATAQAVVTQTLGQSGFVDIAAPFTENLAVQHNFHPAPADIDDLKPGALADLISSVREQITAGAEQSVQGQAHIRPDAAVTLLT